ncbi:MAG: type II secretion system protein GspM [Methylocystis sp.]
MTVNLVVLLVAYLIFVEPIESLVEERTDALIQRQTTLARYSSVATQEAAVRAFASQVAESNARGELIGGSNPGIIDANLQARLKALSEQSNVSVTSIQMLPPKAVHGATLVGARLDVSASSVPLHALARALEKETPLLLVMAATLRGQAGFWGRPADAAGSTDPTIEAQFDVYGGALGKEQP